MASDENEEKLLRSVALQNAQSILLARQQAEQALIEAKVALELRTEELAHSLAMMRATLESTTDGILVTDDAGKVTGFNGKFVEMWRIPPETMDSREHRQLLEVCGRQFKDPEQFRLRVEAIYASSPPESYDLLELVDGRVVERFSKIQRIDERNVGRVWSFRDITQRRRAEEALQKQSEWLRVTLFSIGDAVITTDTEERVTSLNPVAESLTGWTQQEARGRPLNSVFRMINEQSRQPVENPATRAMREGRIVGLANHTVLIAKDGTERAIDDSAAPIRAETGHISGVVLIFRDVTEARRAAKALQQSEARYRSLTQAITSVVWTVDEAGRFVTPQPSWSEYTGQTWEELRDFGWANALHPDDRERVWNLWEAARASKTLYKSDGRLWHTASGSYRHFEARGVPILNADGSVREWVGKCLDVEDRKRAEQTTRFLADASAELAELTDPESTLQKVASLAVPFFADWCAVDLQEADGSLRRLAVTHIDPAKVQLVHELYRRYPPSSSDSRGVMKVLRSVQSDWAAEIPDSLLIRLAQDEEHLRLLRELGLKSYICVPLKAHSKALGAITFVTAESSRIYETDDVRAAEDLAHRAVIAIENASLLATLKESDRRKDEFLAMLAHELRNPLAPIRNAAEILRVKGPPIPELQWAREVIDRQIQQMTRLIDDLLDVSRITTGKIELRRERVELAAVVKSAVEASRPLIEKWGHELTVTIPPEPIHLEADSTRLSQAIESTKQRCQVHAPRRPYLADRRATERPGADPREGHRHRYLRRNAAPHL